MQCSCQHWGNIKDRWNCGHLFLCPYFGLCSTLLCLSLLVAGREKKKIWHPKNMKYHVSAGWVWGGWVLSVWKVRPDEIPAVDFLDRGLCNWMAHLFSQYIFQLSLLKKKKKTFSETELKKRTSTETFHILIIPQSQILTLFSSLCIMKHCRKSIKYIS